MDREISREPRAWWKQRRVAIGIAVAVFVICGWFLIPASNSVDIDEDELDFGMVERTAFDDYLPVRAMVVPALTTDIGVINGGQVQALLVEDGALVSEGQPLVELSNPELRLEVLTQEAQIASQLGMIAGEKLGIERNRADRNTVLQKAEYDLIEAQRQYGLRRPLHEKGFISDAGIQRYAAEVEFQLNRVAQLRSERSRETRFTAEQAAMLDATQARLQDSIGALRTSLDGLTIRAPKSGRLTNFNLRPGQTLAARDLAGQIDSEGEWQLQANIDEFYLDRLRAGLKGQTVDGTNLVVARVLPTVSGGRFSVEFSIAGYAAQKLSRGQTLDVRIVLGARTQALVAPVGAWLKDGTNSVFVVDTDGNTARRRAVTVGRRNPRQVEVLSGLKPGDRIVTSSLSRIEGDIVNIR